MGKLTGKPLMVDEFIDNYWTYYQDLELQVAKIRRYISFSRKNYRTFSIETLRLLQAICSEIDVFAKQVAIEYSDDGAISDYGTIKMWGPAVYFTFPNICSVRAKIVNSECVVWPWRNWRYVRTEATSENGTKKVQTKYSQNCGSPSWWNVYNTVKHKRAFVDGSGAHNFEKANLRNLLEALGALFILESLYSARFDSFKQFESKLFVK